MHICVCMYICAFFCGECCVHFRTGVLSTSACAVVCFIQMFLWHQHTHLWHIRCRLCTYAYMHKYVYMHAYVYGCDMDANVRLWYCLTRWLGGVVAEIFCLCIDVRVNVYVYACACMCAYVHLHMYVYAYMRVCVCVCIYMYMHTRVGVNMHSCRRILLFCTVQSLYYMHVYQRHFFHTCIRVWWGIGSGVFFPACPLLALVTGEGGYVWTGVEIGVLSYRFLCFCGCSGGVCVCACIRSYTHTNYLGTWCEPRCRTDTWRASEPEQSRSTKSQHTCRLYRCTKYICQYVCWVAGFDDLG